MTEQEQVAKLIQEERWVELGIAVEALITERNSLERDIETVRAQTPSMIKLIEPGKEPHIVNARALLLEHEHMRQAWLEEKRLRDALRIENAELKDRIEILSAKIY